MLSSPENLGSGVKSANSTFVLDWAYALLAVLAIFTWHGEKWLNKSREVLKAVLGSFLLGGLFFACDLILGHLNHPDLSLVEAAEQSGGPFGFWLTILVCPVMTLFLLAGYFRAVFLEEKPQDV